MGLHTFLIHLDNASGSYVSHKDTTQITGRVVIVMGKSKQVEGLKLNFRGKAKVIWTERYGKHTVTYIGRQKFFTQSFCLVGAAGPGTREKVLLTSGEHSFPFCLTLPANLPNSCTEVHGTIKYTVEAIIERSWKTNFNTKRRLHVVAPLDLSTTPDILLPGIYADEKHFCCLWCRSKPVNMVVSLPSRGIVIGQDFPITVEVDNTSNVDVNMVVAKIKKYTTVRLEPPRTLHHVTSKTICSVEIGAVPKKGSIGKTVLLPPLTEPAINVDTCMIMDIEYFLEVTAASSGCHGDLCIQKPVRFGSLPVVRQEYHYTNAGFVADFDDFRPPPPPPYAAPPLPYAPALQQPHGPPYEASAPPPPLYAPPLPNAPPLQTCDTEAPPLDAKHAV